jgi:ElaB/YqjD/DUF883 family membrane-anchored ribosome-binding protein
MEAKSIEGEPVRNQFRETVQELGEHAKAVGTAAWERAKEGCSAVQEKTIAGAKATDRVIRNNPYQAIGIAFGAGLLIGLLLKRNK